MQQGQPITGMVRRQKSLACSIGLKDLETGYHSMGKSLDGDGIPARRRQGLL